MRLPIVCGPMPVRDDDRRHAALEDHRLDEARRRVTRGAGARRRAEDQQVGIGGFGQEAVGDRVADDLAPGALGLAAGAEVVQAVALAIPGRRRPFLDGAQAQHRPSRRSRHAPGRAARRTPQSTRRRAAPRAPGPRPVGRCCRARRRGGGGSSGSTAWGCGQRRHLQPRCVSAARASVRAGAGSRLDEDQAAARGRVAIIAGPH